MKTCLCDSYAASVVRGEALSQKKEEGKQTTRSQKRIRHWLCFPPSGKIDAATRARKLWQSHTDAH